MSATIVTVERLSQCKALPAEFLAGLGLTDVPGEGVNIPYIGLSGETRGNKLRTAERAKDGSIWQKGKKLAAYGEARLGGRHKEHRVILVEGESDCWALWYHGWAALGIPGSGCAGVLDQEHLAYCEEIYVHQEPDAAGANFVTGVARRLAELNYSGRAWVFRLGPKYKDLADLHCLRTGDFNRYLQETLNRAAPLPLPAMAQERAAKNAEPAAETARVVSLADLAPEKVAWLWPGRIPLGTLTILDGDPGTGKSTLTLDLAARLTQGKPLPFADAAPPKARSVVLLSAEDDMANTVGPRLRAAGADLDRVKAFTEIASPSGTHLPCFPENLPLLEELIEREEAGLVVIDPLMAFFGRFTDAHRDSDVRAFLYQLAQVARRTKSAVLVVRHLNKASGMQAMYRGGGSIGIIGAVRSGLMVGRDPRAASAVDAYLLAVTKCNLAERAPSIRYRVREENGVAGIDWLGHVACDVDELVGRAAFFQIRAVDDAVHFLKRHLAGGPQPVPELQAKAQAGRLSWSSVRRARLILGVVTATPTSFGGAWTWQLPETPVLAAVE